MHGDLLPPGLPPLHEYLADLTRQVYAEGARLLADAPAGQPARAVVTLTIEGDDGQPRPVCSTEFYRTADLEAVHRG